MELAPLWVTYKRFQLILDAHKNMSMCVCTHRPMGAGLDLTRVVSPPAVNIWCIHTCVQSLMCWRTGVLSQWGRPCGHEWVTAVWGFLSVHVWVGRGCGGTEWCWRRLCQGRGLSGQNQRGTAPLAQLALRSLLNDLSDSSGRRPRVCGSREAARIQREWA